MALEAVDEHQHDGMIDEYWFAWWDGQGSGGCAGIQAAQGSRELSYWWAVIDSRMEVIHIADLHVPTRSTPLLVKGELLWAEFSCEDAHSQWTLANEARAVVAAPSAPIDSVIIGQPIAVASDIEWYATHPCEALEHGIGYSQIGVVHGLIEYAGRAPTQLDEVASWRCHRWWASGEEPPSPFARADNLDVSVAIPRLTGRPWMLGPHSFGWAMLSSSDDGES